MATACTHGIDPGFVDLGTTKVALLGALQGMTEMLPISATAHMRIVPTVLGWPDPGAAFAAAMQLAAAVAITVFYGRDVVRLGRGTIEAARSGDYRSFEFRTAVGLMIASLPLLIGWLVFGRRFDLCATPSREMWVIGAASRGVAVMLAFAQLVRGHRRDFEQLRLRDAVALGLAQCFALIPGVSRSGAALTGALLVDLKPAEAVRWAFLAGLPAAFGIGLRGVAELRRAGLDSHGWSLVGTGFVAATLAAVLGLWILNRVMARLAVWPFVAYRTVFGAFLLLVVWLDVLA